MKKAYPIIITRPDNKNKYYSVYIPTFNINTEGKSIENAIQMARDAIGIAGITLEDMNKSIPECDDYNVKYDENQLTTIVDVDFASYRNSRDNRSVKKNCTIPYWLNKKAEEAHINFSQVLQEALIKILD